jgi:hypothetical protein
VPFGSLLIAFGLFLLGGSYSIFRADHEQKGRTGAQVGVAVVLLLAGLLAVAGGVLRLV